MNRKHGRLNKSGVLVALFVVAALLVVITSSCDRESTGPAANENDPEYSIALKTSAIDVNPDPPKNQNQFGIVPAGELISWSSTMGGAPNCVFYEHDGDKTMAIRHTYTTPTCCAFDIWVDIAVENGVISIAEYDTPGFLPALSLYDLKMQITNLRPGSYTVTITNDYQVEPLEFTVDLITEPTGTYCVE